MDGCYWLSLLLVAVIFHSMNVSITVVVQVLDLSPGEVEIVREKLHVFAQNGFDIREVGNGQLALAAVPFSKNVTFSKDDVLELVGLLSNDGGGMNSQAMFSLGSNTPSGLPLHRPSK